MINKFEAGKKYKWVGPKQIPNSSTPWNTEGEMDFILTKTLICLDASAHNNAYQTVMFSEDQNWWSLGKDTFKYFIELSTKEPKVGDKVSFIKDFCCNHLHNIEDNEVLAIIFKKKDLIIVENKNGVAFSHKTNCVSIREKQ